MASTNALSALEIFRQKGIRFIDKTQAMRLFGLESANTAYKFLQRLERRKVIKRVTTGIYVLASDDIGDFEVANAVISPSYVSLESALSYYGVLSQFPYEISSVTTKRSRKFTFRKEFEYTHINKKLYWGFVKDNKFVIATAEKALLDMLYLVTKGLRKLDVDELETSTLDKDLLRRYCQKFNLAAITEILKKKKII